MIASRMRAASIAAMLATAAVHAHAQGTRFSVTVAPSVHAGPLTGRLIVAVSKTQQPEPRLAISPSGPAIFGVDLEQLAAGKAAIVDDRAVGYPTALGQLQKGEYWVQPIINVYERVTRADGKSIWVHVNDGSVEFFSNAAGNLYGEAKKVRVGDGGTIALTVDKVMPAAPKEPDTEWLKHVTLQSAKLTAFWGRPIHIKATVLLPKGYADHPNERYPVLFPLGHGTPFQFTTDSAHVRGLGKLNAITGTETGYDFYKSWIADDFPRVIAITLEQQTPYFPDSYSVNSANNGPYGDAIVEEIIPELERRFRAIGTPKSRQLEGASTSGWQTLALMLQHPDFFGGAWVLQPDLIDFRRYQFVDIYADTNAFVMPAGQFTTIERPFRRTTEGLPVWSLRQLSLFEDVLGSRGRSGYQLEAWEAVYGPTDSQGYPKPLWNKRTGTIDRTVADYMREHGFDLRAYAERNWSTLGPKLAGKLHFFAGDMDDFYLNLAVYKMDEFLKSTTNPTSDAEFTYGRPMKGHGWHAWPWGGFVRLAAAAAKE